MPNSVTLDEAARRCGMSRVQVRESRAFTFIGANVLEADVLRYEKQRQDAKRRSSVAPREAQAARATGGDMTASTLVAQLFDEFVDAHVSRERPDVRAFLLKAGSESHQLGVLIDRYLEAAPVEAPDQETVVALNARLEHLTPLTAARRRLPLKIDDVVEQLRELLGLDEALRTRLRAAYQELEAEQLDPAGVSERVWDALRSILGLDPRRLVVREKPTLAAPAYLRAADFRAAEAAPPAIQPDEPDEVDSLFRGRRLK
jgi:hypothetical protein